MDNMRRLFNIKINTKYEYNVFAPGDATAVNTALNDFVMKSDDPIKNIQCKEIKGELLEAEFYKEREEFYREKEMEDNIKNIKQLNQIAKFMFQEMPI